jgi:hypothetical protein
VRWHRDIVRRRWAARSAHARTGRPAIQRNIKALIGRLARENPEWGYRRIHGELAGLGVNIAASTVWEILKASGINPGRRRTGPTWSQFLRSQAEAILACDFFTVDLLDGTQAYVLAVIEHATEQLSRPVDQGSLDLASHRFSQTAVAGHAEPEPARQPSPRPYHAGQLKPLGRPRRAPARGAAELFLRRSGIPGSLPGSVRPGKEPGAVDGVTRRCGARRHPGSRGVARGLAAAGKPVSRRALAKLWSHGLQHGPERSGTHDECRRGGVIPSETTSLAGR